MAFFYSQKTASKICLCYAQVINKGKLPFRFFPLLNNSSDKTKAWVDYASFKVPMKWNFSSIFYSRKLKSMLHWLTIFEFKLWSGTQNNFSFPPRSKLENYGSEDHRLHQFSIKKVGENYTGSGCDMQKHSSDCGMWLVNQGDVSVTYLPNHVQQSENTTPQLLWCPKR